MATSFRSVARVGQKITYVCPQCRHSLQGRAFSASTATPSGHSRWSKIKHDKAVVDAKKNKQRSIFSHELALATKLSGPDPNSNPRLALAMLNAKKAGFPKASIEQAILRGQGLGASGAKLEFVTVEAMIPPTVATVIDCETDSKLRTLADVRSIVKKHGGQVTPTGYLFNRRGRIVLQPTEGATVQRTLEDIMEPALDAGAIDIDEDEEGGFVVLTEPSDVYEVAERLGGELGLDVMSSEIGYEAIDRVELGSDAEAETLQSMIDALKDTSGVQEVYVNVA